MTELYAKGNRGDFTWRCPPVPEHPAPWASGRLQAVSVVGSMLDRELPTAPQCISSSAEGSSGAWSNFKWPQTQRRLRWLKTDVHLPSGSSRFRKGEREKHTSCI